MINNKKTFIIILLTLNSIIEVSLDITSSSDIIGPSIIMIHVLMIITENTWYKCKVFTW